jgi:hypothetical protein
MAAKAAQAWQPKQAAAGPDAMTGQARCRAFTASAANASSSSAGHPRQLLPDHSAPGRTDPVSEPGEISG